MLNNYNLYYIGITIFRLKKLAVLDEKLIEAFQ